MIVGSFPGIGSEISKNLLKNFKTIKNFINADIKELKEVEKIGKKKAQKIMDLFEKTYEEG
jgi:ERCC4-type nuclease